MISIAWSCPRCRRDGQFTIKAKTPAADIGKALIDAHRAAQPIKVEDRCPLDKFQFSMGSVAGSSADLYAEMRA